MILRDLIPNLDKPAVSGSLDTEITGLAYDSRKLDETLGRVFAIENMLNTTLAGDTLARLLTGGGRRASQTGRSS